MIFQSVGARVHIRGFIARNWLTSLSGLDEPVPSPRQGSRRKMKIGLEHHAKGIWSLTRVGLSPLQRAHLLRPGPCRLISLLITPSQPASKGP